MFVILVFLFEVVISHVYFTNVDSLTWGQDICIQLARAWDRASSIMDPLVPMMGQGFSDTDVAYGVFQVFMTALAHWEYCICLCLPDKTRSATRVLAMMFRKANDTE